MYEMHIQSLSKRWKLLYPFLKWKIIIIIIIFITLAFFQFENNIPCSLHNNSGYCCDSGPQYSMLNVHCNRSHIWYKKLIQQWKQIICIHAQAIQSFLRNLKWKSDAKDHFRHYIRNIERATIVFTIKRNRQVFSSINNKIITIINLSLIIIDNIKFTKVYGSVFILFFRFNTFTQWMLFSIRSQSDMTAANRLANSLEK